MMNVKTGKKLLTLKDVSGLTQAEKTPELDELEPNVSLLLETYATENNWHLGTAFREFASDWNVNPRQAENLMGMIFEQEAETG